MSRSELYRLAFGRAAPVRPREISMRLFDGDGPNRTALGTTEIIYSEDFSSFRFISTQFARYLDYVLIPEARAEAGDSVGYFSSETLNAAGYYVNADEMLLELRIIVPRRNKVTRRTLLGRDYIGPGGDEVEPAKVSFYMNYQLDGRHSYDIYKYQTATASGYSRQPMYLDLEGALAAVGWVFEGSALMREPDEGDTLSWDHFSRGEARGVRDFRHLSSRLRVGDVSVYSEVMGGDAMGGARWEHNGWLFGEDPRDGTDVVTFFLAKPGYVLVYVDGEYRQRLDLPAGQHEISGIDSRTGRSDVRLFLVTNDDRAAERVDIKYLYSSERNLFKDELRYSVTAGFRRDYVFEPWTYEYEFRQPGVHADMMYGLHYALSVGLAAQVSRENGGAGASLLWDMGRLGWTELRASASAVGYKHPGARADISYTPRIRPVLDEINKVIFFRRDTLTPPPLGNLSLTARGYYSSGNYSEALFSPAVITGAEYGRAGASGNLGIDVAKFGISGMAGADYHNADGTGFLLYEYNYGLRVSRSFGRANFNASGGVRVRDNVRTPYFTLNTNASLGASYRRHRFSAGGSFNAKAKFDEDEVRPPSGAVTVPSSYDMAYSANAGWRWSNFGQGSGAQSYSATAYLPDLQDGVNPYYVATGHYAHNRADISAYYNFAETDYAFANSLNYTRSSHSLHAQASGSFMYADGLWAFGRRVHNGFALFDSYGSLGDARLHINRMRNSKNDHSHSGALGAAYYERVPETGFSNMSLTVTGAPPGTVLPQNSYHAMGAYKQGYALRVGDKPTVLLTVRFMDGANPLPHAYLTIEPADADDKTRVAARKASFTSSAGILQTGGLEPGASYTVKFGTAAGLKDITIKIPSGAGAMFEMGDVAVEKN